VEDFVAAVRVIAASAAMLDRLPSANPRMMLRLYLYCHLNEVRSSRRLERGIPDQSRSDVADRRTGAGLQDGRRLPPCDNLPGIVANCRALATVCREVGLVAANRRRGPCATVGATSRPCNVQIAVDAVHHIIVPHRVATGATDNRLFAPMARATKDAL
jgi:hypothetical protein